LCRYEELVPVTTLERAEPATSTRSVLPSLLVLLLSLFVATLASTVVTTALPRMLGDLGGTQTQYTWVVTATLLTATASTPIWGKLADLFNKKTLVQCALVVFVLGSLAAGFSQTAGQLIAARALQGLGVGGLQILGQVAIAALIAPRERGRYAGYQSSATALSTIGGPLLGGFIVDTSWLGWRWCFFVGIPVAVLALIALQIILRIPTVRRAEVRVDYLGAVLIAAGVSVLLIWVSFVGGTFDWVSWQTAAMVGGALVLLGAAVLQELHTAEPIVPIALLRRRVMGLAILGSLAAGTTMYGASVFLSQYFQLSRGHSAAQAGLLTIPMMVGILVASIVGGRLLSRSGRLKPFVVVGAISLALGALLLGLTDQNTPYALLATGMVLMGAGVGLTMQNFVLAVQNAVPQADIGAASSTVSFFRSLGGTVGVAVLGAVLARQIAGGVAAGETTSQAYGGATGVVFLIAAGVALFGVVAAVALRPVRLRTALDLGDELDAVAAPAAGAPADR
jgi:EmrB/QacA subfamily drug resistance transporter